MVDMGGVIVRVKGCNLLVEACDDSRVAAFFAGLVPFALSEMGASLQPVMIGVRGNLDFMAMDALDWRSAVQDLGSEAKKSAPLRPPRSERRFLTYTIGSGPNLTTIAQPLQAEEHPESREHGSPGGRLGYRGGSK